MSQARSRSPHRQSKLLDETALESLVAKKLAKWLVPDSEEVKLLAQFCSTLTHSDNNWKKEIHDEVLPFLEKGPTEEFVEWLEKSRWKKEADDKFGKQFLRLRERALQEASGTLPPPEFKTKPKDVKKPRVPSESLASYAQTNFDPLGYGPLSGAGGGESFLPPTACSSYAMPVNPGGGRTHATLRHSSRPPNALEGIPVMPVQPALKVSTSPPYMQPCSPMERRKSIPAKTKKGYPIEVAYGNYDSSKEEYQNMTFSTDQTKDKIEDLRTIRANRRSIMERQTKLLQGLLTKLRDPNCDETQREKLVTLVGKLKDQMQVVKKPD